VYSHYIVVGIGVHEVLIDQSAWRDNTGNSPVVQQAARLHFARCVVGELLGDGDIPVQVLDEDFEEPV
jgi:hypothetical protein